MSIPYTYVYLFYDPFTGLFKIGRSDNPTVRLREVRAEMTRGAVPRDYELLQAWLAPQSRELEVHNHLEKYRRRGEWFDLSEWTKYEPEDYKQLDPASLNHLVDPVVQQFEGRFFFYAER